ncbi:4Fe-4S dicluster domain-containing protein [Eggerthella guodeyinii]|uniref:4Fe-4S dicluster domain-containing protein n=1 Tax=Eggerthella guodeyinii TaxID=2690837 RepID=A0A6N7RJ39_9ACTN|nr:4Fe-4S dicluster domain-containing protein [Eggerthella guodeyinii]MRX80930.1 4Fe-4S dicluster domain-containing protein [Eggerthella guodeyinii]QOS69783.1 4Fe-4S dicluster domain-containing protein [Eggerthella guodeyinii]
MSEQRLGMAIDLALCIGCNACAVACKMENGVGLGHFNTWVESWDVDRDGDVRRASVPKLCNHCANPACVSVCPTGASYVDADGSVQIDTGKCIGCKYCMAACPYGVRYLVEETGDVHKCTFCHHRSSNGLLPACVGTCVTKARVFGDLNDPDSDVSKLLAEAGGGEVLLADMGMEPSVRYVDLEETMALKRVSAVHKGGNVLTPYEGRQ